MASRMCRAPTRCNAMTDAYRPHPRSAAIIAGARALLGRRFRPQGRGVTGYDCVGVVLAAGEAAGLPMVDPHAYASDATDQAAVRRWLVRCGFEPRHDIASPGDLLWLCAGMGHHLLVRTDTGAVEAHAGLRRVIERPGTPPPGAFAWRFPMQE